MGNRFYRLPADLVSDLDNVIDPDTARATVVATAIARLHEDVAQVGHALVHRALTAPWSGPIKVVGISISEQTGGQLEALTTALDVPEVFIVRLAMESELRRRTCCKKP